MISKNISVKVYRNYESSCEALSLNHGKFVKRKSNPYNPVTLKLITCDGVVFKLQNYALKYYHHRQSSGVQIRIAR